MCMCRPRGGARGVLFGHRDPSPSASIWKHPLADVSAKAAAPIGADFTWLALRTGSLWGKPMWGAYWVWDARLTSVLILFFLYLGLIALRQAIDDPGRAGRAAAILSLIGAINVPIIKFSVNWWNTLHQPASVLRADGPTIHPALLIPLLIMAIAFTVLFIALHMKAMRAEILRRRCEAMIAVHVRGGGGGSQCLILDPTRALSGYRMVTRRDLWSRA